MNKVLLLSLLLSLVSACGPGPVANNNNNTNSVNVNISESLISDAVKKAIAKEKNATQNADAAVNVEAPSASTNEITDEVKQELQTAPATDREAFSTIIASATAINNRDYDSFVDVFHPDFPWGPGGSPEIALQGIENNNLYQQLGRVQVTNRSSGRLDVYVERLVANNFGVTYELTTYHMRQVEDSWKIFDVTLHQQVPAA